MSEEASGGFLPTRMRLMGMKGARSAIFGVYVLAIEVGRNYQEALKHYERFSVHAWRRRRSLSNARRR